MSSSSSQVAESWISSFCNMVGHEYFAEVSEDFIEDDFNLTGLQSQVPMYKEALEMILDVEPDEEDDEDEDEEDEDDDELLVDDDRPRWRRQNERRHMRMASDLSVIESSADRLYGLIHQRYITSRPGIQQMAEKYDMQHFGLCPRTYCNSSKVLPVGLNDTPGEQTVKLFCPSCLDVYTPPSSRFQAVDGAFFGTTFGALFFMTFTDLDISDGAADALLGIQADAKGSRSAKVTSINGVAPANLAPGLGDKKIYEPRIYGFKVNELARSGPRMRWLRSRPSDITELDEMRRFWETAGAASGAFAVDGSNTSMVDIDDAGGGKPQPVNATGSRKKMRRRRGTETGADGATGGGGGGGDPVVGGKWNREPHGRYHGTGCEMIETTVGSDAEVWIYALSRLTSTTGGLWVGLGRIQGGVVFLHCFICVLSSSFLDEERCSSREGIYASVGLMATCTSYPVSRPPTSLHLRAPAVGSSRSSSSFAPPS